MDAAEQRTPQQRSADEATAGRRPGQVRCHGRGYRRGVRLLLVLTAAIWLADEAASSDRSAGGVLLLAVIAVVAAAIMYLWWGRRPGVSWDEQGVTLTGAIRQRRIAWRDVATLSWVTRTAFGDGLQLTTRDGEQARVPTVLRIKGPDWFAGFWESHLLRAGPAEEPVDAMIALTAGREASRARDVAG